MTYRETMYLSEKNAGAAPRKLSLSPFPGKRCALQGRLHLTQIKGAHLFLRH
jgi:hypothetical protein